MLIVGSQYSKTVKGCPPKEQNLAKVKSRVLIEALWTSVQLDVIENHIVNQLDRFGRLQFLLLTDAVRNLYMYY